MKKNLWRKRLFVSLLSVLVAVGAMAQNKAQKQEDEQIIKISTELVQLDAVVLDKNGRVVKNLTKDDFELIESGKKQQITFFEYVEGRKLALPVEQAPKKAEPISNATNLSAADVRRIFAFVVDDLTIRPTDMTLVRQMLTNFVQNQMQPTDLVAIVRTVGGRGILQQFTADKNILARVIESLTPATHPLGEYSQAPGLGISLKPDPLSSEGASNSTGESTASATEFINPTDDTIKASRAYMSLATSAFLIEGMKQLPGRKSLVLVSGGLPLLDVNYSTAGGNVSSFINRLIDHATRAGVAIDTMDIAGLSSQVGIARFEDTPGKSMLGGSSMSSNDADPAFGRGVDPKMFGRDTLTERLGLKILASSTGGIAVLNKNDFNAGLQKILDASEGYYLLAYTPEAQFDNKFHKVEIKVKRDGLKVLSRQGYLAQADKNKATATTKEEQILTAIRSPLARRDIDLDALLLYKPVPPDKAAISINLSIAPEKLQFDMVDNKQQSNFDVAGFVFDEFGKLRGGFSETLTVSFAPQEFGKIAKTGVPYAADTMLPPGIYQVRLAVRDNKSGNIGTMSRYIEVADLAKGRLTASSLLLGAAPPNDTQSPDPKPLSANRQISRKSDLRYATFIYNAKLKDGKPQVKTQMMISQNGQKIYEEPEEMLQPSGNNTPLLKVGQLGLSRVKPGRYTLTLIITDSLADKKAQTVTRSMDFAVVD